MSEAGKGEHMSIGEFYDSGLLQEVNRQFFHPLGLALACHPALDETATSFTVSVWDDRSDPEGILFDLDGDAREEVVRRAGVFAAEMAAAHAEREKRLGFVVQPLPDV